MKCSFSYLAVLVLLVCGSNIAQESQSEDLATYVWLEREGILDETVSTSKVHELLKQGIDHSDPDIVHCSISAISWYVGVTAEGRVHGMSPTVPDRELQKIPGLYDRFVELWDAGFEESNGVYVDGIYPEVDEDTALEESRVLCDGPTNIWVVLPFPLAYLFPGDQKVYDIIWEALPQRKDPGALLIALFEGEFNEPRDQQFRIDVLKTEKTLDTTRD